MSESETNQGNEIGKSESVGGSGRSLGQRAAAGAVWMAFEVVAAKASVFLAQIVLGWLLFEEDFALWGAVMPLAIFVRSLHFSGLRKLLIQRGEEYERMVGAVFWISMVLSILVAMIYVGASPLAVAWFKNDAVAPLMVLIVLEGLFLPGARVLNAKLAIDLRFKALAVIMVVGNLIRLVVAIALAALGFGAACFLWAMVVVAIFELVVCQRLTHSSPWLHGPNFRMWPTLLRQGKWLLLVPFAATLGNHGDYLVLAPKVEPVVFGVYVFGYQLAIQITTLVARNLQAVLFPTLSKFSEDSPRFSEVVTRVVRVLVLLGAPGFFLLAAAFQPLEMLLWHGKWAAAVNVVALLSIGWSGAVMGPAARSILESRGRFRTSFFCELLHGVGLTLAAALALVICHFTGGADQLMVISVTVGCYMMASGLAQMAAAAMSGGISLWQVPGSLLPRYLICFIAFGAAVWLARSWPAVEGESFALTVLKVCAIGSVFTAAYTALALIFFRGDLSYFMQQFRRRSARKAEPTQVGAEGESDGNSPVALG